MPYSMPGERHAHQPEHPAEGHDHRKRDGQNPDRRRTELRAPQADSNHRKHVIEPGDRMRKPAEEAAASPFCA